MVATMSAPLVLVAMLSVSASVQAVDQNSALVANPIRKVVTMLQNMEKKVAAEGEKEQAIFDKFMCYCKNAGGDLSTSIAASDAKVSDLPSAIKEAEASLVQTKEELKGHQADRSAAKAAMASATALRGKEAAEFGKEKAEASANIAALGGAISAITSGMAGSLLQTSQAQVLKQLMMTRDVLDADRQDVMAFLSGDQAAPQSGEITGILKTMKESMSKSLAESEAAEAEAISGHEQLLAAKEKEVAANTKAIEVKTVRVGEAAVHIVTMKNDLSDTQEALEGDKKFLADLDTNCASQTKEWEEHKKVRSQELLALADTIKLLNDDDALELFKKTLPGAGASFMQTSTRKADVRRQALAVLREVHRPQFDFITLAIEGKQAGFEKVIKMIDGMTVTLTKEQHDDDHKKEYCGKQFDFASDKKKGLTKTVSDLEISIENAKEGVTTLAAEIEALEDGIKALDKSVSESTDQRKEESEDYTELMASDASAKELLKFAQNRLNKFYNPKLYKAPPAPVFAQKGAPAKVGAYKKKGEESNGVIAMINLLIQDLDKEMTEAKTGEKAAQGDYEQMLGDSAEKRATDSKSLTEKNDAKAGLQSDVESDTDAKGSAVNELMATEKYISSLHGECDWLLQYFEVRKTARTTEIESLTTAKAVLSGADVSLLQKNRRAKFLRGQESM